MKKKLFAFAAILLLALTGCANDEANTEAESLRVYSFHGENEQFAIANGVIVLSDTEDVFYGGDLSVKEGALTGISSFTTTFYYLSDGEENTLLSNAVTDQTGGSAHVSGDLGSRSGSRLASRADDDITDLQNNLFFELTTTDQNGEENVYLLQLTVKEI